MNEYLSTLYDWISSQDTTFKDRRSKEEFMSKMENDADYNQQMYTWISGVDATFTDRYTPDAFQTKTGLKKKEGSEAISEEQPVVSATPAQEEPGLLASSQEQTIDNQIVEQGQPQPDKPLAGKTFEDFELAGVEQDIDLAKVLQSAGIDQKEFDEWRERTAREEGLLYRLFKNKRSIPLYGEDPDVFYGNREREQMKFVQSFKTKQINEIQQEIEQKQKTLSNPNISTYEQQRLYREIQMLQGKLSQEYRNFKNIEKNFPNYMRMKSERALKEKELIDRYRKGGIEGFMAGTEQVLGQVGKAAADQPKKLLSTVAEFLDGTLSAVGFDKKGLLAALSEDLTRSMEQEQEQSDLIERPAFIQGKEVVVDGIKYVVSGDGIVYDEQTLVPVNDLMSENEIQSIVKKAEDVEEEEVYTDLGAGVGAMGSTLVNLMGLIRGGNILQKSLGVGPKLSVGLWSTAQAMGQEINSLTEELIASGIGEKEAIGKARVYGGLIATLDGVWTGITGANDKLIPKKQAIKELLYDLVEKDGKKFTKQQLFKKGKELINENFKELVEEFGVLYSTKAINSLMNTDLEQEIRKVDYANKADILETLVMTLGATNALGASRVFTNNDRNNMVRYVADNIEDIDGTVKSLIDEGLISIEDGKSVADEIKRVREAELKVAGAIKETENMLTAAELIKTKERLIQVRENQDPALREDTDKKIASIDAQLKLLQEKDKKDVQDAIQKQKTRDISDAQPAESVQEMEEEVREPAVQEAQEVISTEQLSTPDTFTHQTRSEDAIVNWANSGKVIGKNEDINEFDSRIAKTLPEKGMRVGMNRQSPNFQKGGLYSNKINEGVKFVVVNKNEQNFIPSDRFMNVESFDKSKGISTLKPDARDISNFDLYSVNEDGTLTKRDWSEFRTKVSPEGKAETVGQLINRPVTLTKLGGSKLDAPIEGDMYLDGQQVVVEDANGNITEIGNVDEISGKTLEELGIEQQQPAITTTEDGNIEFEGETYNPDSARIRRDSRGNITSVTLDQVGKPRSKTFRGKNAEDAAYNVLLRQADQSTEIEQLLEQDEEFQNELRQAEAAAKTAADQDTRPPVTEKTKLQGLVDNAKKAIAKLGLNVEIIMPETEAEYMRLTNEEGRESDFGGKYINGKIYINPAKANGRTVAHEVFHALLLSRGMSDAQARAITERMLSAVKKSADADLLARLEEFSSQYPEALQSEESIAELFGILADGYPDLPAPTQNIIKRWLDKLAKILGLKPFTDAEVIDLLNTVSGKVARGEQITEADIKMFDDTGRAKTSAERKQIIGENAALTEQVRQDLSAANQMENMGKDAQAIRIATGWERGKDGKWRYEIVDNIPLLSGVVDRINKAFDEIAQGIDTDGKIYKIGPDVLGIMAEDAFPPELLKLYPQLKDIKVVFNNKSTGGIFNSEDLTIEVGMKKLDMARWAELRADVMDTVSVLLHEIQHAIQVIEIFAAGGSTNLADYYNSVRTERDLNEQFAAKEKIDTFYGIAGILEAVDIEIGNGNVDEDISIDEIFSLEFLENNELINEQFDTETIRTVLDYLKNEEPVYKEILGETLFNNGIEEAMDYAYDQHQEEQKQYEKKYSAFGIYSRLAGEVEARNVQERMNMSEESRREETLQETEDVAREDQIVLFQEFYDRLASEEKARTRGQKITSDYTKNEIDRVKKLPKEAEDGATMNLDGSKYEGGGLVIPLASRNLNVNDLSVSGIQSFINENSESIGADNVKVGIYKFPNSTESSIDINIVADPSMREEALKIGKELGQESLFDLDTFENIKTGADGKNPKKLTPAEFLAIQKRLQPTVTRGQKVTKNYASSIQESLKFAEQSSIPNKLEFKKALQERFYNDVYPEIKDKYNIKDNKSNSDKGLKQYLIDAYLNETLTAIEAYPDALGWYDAKINAAMSLMSELHPEIATNKDAASTFKIALAITSNGNKVYDNFVEANRQYEYFKENGKFDESYSIGDQKAGILSSLSFANKALESMSMADFTKFLTTKYRAGDLKYIKKGKKTNLLPGFAVDEEVYGASIFGPKIGNGFFMNLYGEFNQLTMDRWFMRQFGRLTGTLLDYSQEKVDAGVSRLSKMIGSLSKRDADKLSSIIPNYQNLSTEDLANKIQKASMKLDIRKILKSSNKLDEIRKAGNNLSKLMSAEVEAPRNSSQRKFINDVFLDVQKKLKDEFGIDITIADLQAVNWYPEKALYQTFKADQNTKTGKETTSDNEQPDYENAAKKLIESKGISKEKIKENERRRAKQTERSDANRESVSTRAEQLNKDNEVTGEAKKLKDKIISVKEDVVADDLKPKERGQKISSRPDTEVDRLRKESEENLKNRRKKKESRMLRLRKAFLDRQAFIKRGLKGISGKQALKAARMIVVRAGAKGYAKLRYKKAEKEIFGGLSKPEAQFLESLIYARRIISINKNRRARGMEPYFGKDKYGEAKALKDLQDLKDSIPEKQFNKINARADKYFGVFEENLKRLYDSGRINKETYDQLKDVEYTPIRTLKYLKLSEDELDAEIGMSAADIKTLSNENENDILFDAKWNLMTTINAVEAKAMENRMLVAFNKAFEGATDAEKEAMSEYMVDNPVIGKKKDGTNKRKFEKAEPGYKKVFFFENGVKDFMIIREDMANELLDVKKRDKTAEWLGKATGAQVLRFFATGGNPLFIIGNTAVDFANILFLSDVYSGFKPFGAAQLAWDFTKNFLKATTKAGNYNEIHAEFMEYGGGMDYLSQEGLQALRSKYQKTKGQATNILLKIGEAMSFMGQSSEIAFRLAVYEKTKDNLIKQYKKENGKDPVGEDLEDIKYEAARESRETIDFSQGGTLSKRADLFMPYLNAGFQGYRKVVDYANKNPKGFASSMVQYAGMSAAIIAFSLANLISKLRDDDEEDKLADVLNSVSPYEKASYHIIFTGNKDEDGEYEYIRIKKLPGTGILATMAEQMIMSIADKNYKFDTEAAFNSARQGLPFDPTGLASRNPMVSAFISYGLNYDLFRNQEIFKSPERKVIEPRAEGLFDDRVAGIYKVLGEQFNLSPIRMQAFFEKFITSESTNPFVSLLYSSTEGLYDKDTSFGKEMQSNTSRFFENISRKLIRSTNKKLLQYDENKELKELEASLDTDTYIKERKIYKTINDMRKAKQKITFADIYKMVKENFDPINYKKYLKKYYLYAENPDLDRRVLDIVFEETPEVQAAKLYARYGDNFDNEEQVEIAKALRAVGRKSIGKKTLYIYYTKYKK